MKALKIILIIIGVLVAAILIVPRHGGSKR